VTLVDTWGWSEDNYKDGIFKHILKGNLKNGWRMEWDVDESNTKFNDKPTITDMMHVAIFVLAGNSVENEASAGNPYYVRLRKFRDDCARCNVLPIVLLTKVDLVDKNLSTNFKDVFTSDPVTNLLDLILVGGGFSIDSIFPFQSYHAKKERDAHIECAALMCLADAMRKARTYRLKYESKKSAQIEDTMRRQLGVGEDRSEEDKMMEKLRNEVKAKLGIQADAAEVPKKKPIKRDDDENAPQKKNDTKTSKKGF